MVGGLKSPHANVHGAGVPGQLGADVGLAPGWHPHHADDVLHAAAAGAVGGDLPLGLGHGLRHTAGGEVTVYEQVVTGASGHAAE